MKRRPSPAAAILVLALLGAGASFVGVSAPRATPQPDFPESAIPGASLSIPDGIDTSGEAHRNLAAMSLGAPEPSPEERSVGLTAVTPGPRPRPTASSPKAAPASPRPAPAVKRVRRPQGVQYSIRASWYCGHGSRCTVGHPGGLYAAISPDLRQWAGRRVLVRNPDCTPTRERPCVVTVTLIDCLCSREHGIDLYSEAFDKLAALSVGVITVTLEAQP